jgi:hypothetical protein
MRKARYSNRQSKGVRGVQGVAGVQGEHRERNDWRGAAFARTPVDQANLIYDWSGRNGSEKQAAPGNDPAFGSSIGRSNRNIGQKHSAG